MAGSGSVRLADFLNLTVGLFVKSSGCKMFSQSADVKCEQKPAVVQGLRNPSSHHDVSSHAEAIDSDQEPERH